MGPLRRGRELPRRPSWCCWIQLRWEPGPGGPGAVAPVAPHRGGSAPWPTAKWRSPPQARSGSSGSAMIPGAREGRRGWAGPQGGGRSLGARAKGSGPGYPSSGRNPVCWQLARGTDRMAQVPWRRRMADLSIEVRQAGDVAVLLPARFINAHTVREFDEALEGLVRDGRYTILLNCKNLNYISSAGLGAIMGLIETVREHQGDILLSDLQPNVFAIFDTLGFTQLYRVFGAEDQALAAVTPERKG